MFNRLSKALCTMTVLAKPFTLSVNVVEPGDVAEQPVEECGDAAAATPALKGVTPSARSDSVATATTTVTTWSLTIPKCRVIVTPFIGMA